MNSWKSTCERSVHGMADVVFEDYSMKVKTAIANRIDAVLEECAGELESQVKRNQDTNRYTGQTTNSWRHRVIGSVLAEHYEAIIGSSEENAIWEEYGTGEYALNGNGRKGGWSYEDETGVWHRTNGKAPRRHFWKAYNSLKSKIISRIQNSLKGL